MISSLQKRGAEFLMPCRGISRAAAALREFERGAVPAASENVLANSGSSA